jgi:sulfate permease, SulP family
MYIVQSGVLRATYTFDGVSPAVVENMVPGTLAGELSAIAGEPRNATVVADTDAVVWRLSPEAMRELEESEPEMMKAFVKMVLKGEFRFSSRMTMWRG